MPYYQCQNGTIITDGENILDVRLGADDDPMPERHPCKDFFDTCCSLRSDMPDKAIPPEIKYDKCGVRNANGVGFMVKTRDSEAQYGTKTPELIIFHIFNFFYCISMRR